MSLKDATNGDTVRIISINASDANVNRLCSMGILPGSDVQIVNNKLWGATHVNCMGTRLILGRDLPQKINVKLL